METVLQLIEGTFGALVMFLGGVGALISAPICVALIVWMMVKKVKGWKPYALCGAIPLFCFVVALGMFVLRAFTAVFFTDGGAPM
jgi:hypothetical protein